jgi:single-strand DNA-binding protein
MARSLNKLQIIGNLGADPDIRILPSGQNVANFRVATTDQWKDKDGEKQEQTEWHAVAIFGPLADVVEKYLKKGSKVYIEGSLRTRKWQDKEGQDRYTTEVIGKELLMLDPPNKSRDDAPASNRSSARGKPAATNGRPAATTRKPPTSARRQPAPAPQDYDEEGDFDDEIPI